MELVKLQLIIHFVLDQSAEHFLLSVWFGNILKTIMSHLILTFSAFRASQWLDSNMKHHLTSQCQRLIWGLEEVLVLEPQLFPEAETFISI